MWQRAAAITYLYLVLVAAGSPGRGPAWGGDGSGSGERLSQAASLQAVVQQVLDAFAAGTGFGFAAGYEGAGGASFGIGAGPRSPRAQAPGTMSGNDTFVLGSGSKPYVVLGLRGVNIGF